MTTSKKLLVLASTVLLLAACSAAAEPDAEPAAEPSASESAEALTYTGYCDVSANGTLSGRCRGCSTMCITSAASACPAGAAPVKAAAYPAACGVVRFDAGRRCSLGC